MENLNQTEKTLVIKSEVDEIAKVEFFIEELTSELKVKDDVYGNILVSVTEAVNNAILHGNKQDPSKEIEITTRMIGSYLLSIKVVDQGLGFDYQNAIDPTSSENLTKPSGRGVFVMKHLSDGLTYYNVGNIVEMMYNI